MALLFLLSVLQPQDSVIVIQSSMAWAVDTCQRSVSVREPELFSRGDRVVLHAPVCAGQGAMPHVAAGEWSWNVVDTITQHRLWLRYPVPGTLQRYRQLQIVRAHKPAERHLSVRIVAKPWDGMDGGVVAIWAASAIDLHSQVSATGAGFGAPIPAWNTRDTTTLNNNGTTDLPLRPVTHLQGACRAPFQNHSQHPWLAATADGIPRNGGGTGGRGADTGGRGGRTSTAFPPVTVTQNGASQPPSQDSKLTFGMAGACGHGNDMDAGIGGRGGGIVLIYCSALHMHPGSVISADGVNGHDASHDGAGAGGGAGTIVIDSDTLTGTGTLSVRGGHGGSTHSTLFVSGPGGGGSGGRVCTHSAIPATIRVQVDAGAAGSARTRIWPAAVSDHSARPGAGGRIDTTMQRWRDLASAGSTPRLRSADSVVDRGSTTTIWAENVSSVDWLDTVTASSAMSATTTAIHNGRWFRARLKSLDGCVTIDSVHVRPTPASPVLTFSVGDLRGRAGDSVDVYLNVRTSGSIGRSIEGVAHVSTHPRVLLPVRGSGDVVRGRTRLTLPFRLSSASQSTYRRDRLLAVLGDSSAVQISIDSVVISMSAASLTIRRQHGTFTLEDICRQGGAGRLFDGQILVAINGRMIQSRAANLYICDLLGRIVAQYENPERVERQVTIESRIQGLIFVVLSDNDWMRSIPVWLE